MKAQIAILLCAAALIAAEAPYPYPARQVPRGPAFNLPARQTQGFSQNSWGRFGPPPQQFARSQWEQYGPPPSDLYGPPTTTTTEEPTSTTEQPTTTELPTTTEPADEENDPQASGKLRAQTSAKLQEQKIAPDQGVYFLLLPNEGRLQQVVYTTAPLPAQQQTQAYTAQLRYQQMPAYLQGQQIAAPIITLPSLPFNYAFQSNIKK